MPETQQIVSPHTVFKPFVSPDENRPEFTIRAVLLGAIFGIIFGAVTVYVGLSAGLTVAASIPIAVISISLLRHKGKPSVLETIIVQTCGNAGQSIAAGVIFTLPALIFLGFDLEYFRIFMLALIGGYLGVLFMVPLRRPLIVEEHGILQYPEGTACADVIKAGASGGSTASRVFFGLGLGALYAAFQNENLFGAWPGTPEYQPDFGPQHVLKGASIKADATAEYLGVGYIIGPKTAGIIFAGGVFSWLVLMPLLYFFGKDLPTPIYPGTVPIAQMGPSDLWSHLHPAHGRGRGGRRRTDHPAQDPADHHRRAPVGLQEHAAAAAPPPTRPIRTEHDLSMGVAVVGSIVLDRPHVPLPLAQAGARSAGGPAGQPRRVGAGGHLRIPVRHRQLANRGPDRQLRQPHLRHDHRHPDGHLGHLPGQRLDRARFRRAGHHHRRRGLHRLRRSRRYFAGPQDRLPHRRHAHQAALRASSLASPSPPSPSASRST